MTQIAAIAGVAEKTLNTLFSPSIL